jgi:hypothetical protein
MVESVEQRIVRFDLVMACVTVANGFVLASGLGLQPGNIVAGTAVALATTVLHVGADRSRLGLWMFVVVGVLVVAGLVFVMVELATAGTESWVFGVIPGGMVGLGVGWLLNRVLFGVVGSVPETRVERGLRWSW